jgi:pilus assembly protein CpaB
VIPAELKYVEVIAVTAGSGYDANTGAQTETETGDEKELPSTVTLLVSPEQSKTLAELESDGKLHLSLVYRGTPANTAKFIEAQDKVVAALYPVEPVQDSTSESQEPEESTASEATAESGVE